MSVFHELKIKDNKMRIIKPNVVVMNSDHDNIHDRIKMSQTDIQDTPSDLNEFDETQGYKTVIFVGQSKKDNSCVVIFPSAEDNESKMGTFSDWESAFEFLKMQIEKFVKIKNQQNKEMMGE